MDVTNISSFFNLSSPAVEGAAVRSSTVKFPDDKSFGSFLDSAVKQVNETNTYLKQEEEEEIKWALGLTENTHDLAVAQSKAETALQYTVALRDRFLESYREIIQMQI
ncbi:MAG: flagellar hook-basal body complex protein FliE [Lachnospiraceae bacterium]|nr:flagellar hook-basal body complex protein FliE [Lachnospiraceae bacterium]